MQVKTSLPPTTELSNNESAEHIEKVLTLQQSIHSSEQKIEKLHELLEHRKQDVISKKLTNWMGLVSAGKTKEVVSDLASDTNETIGKIGELLRESNQNTSTLAEMIQDMMSATVTIHTDVLNTSKTMAEFTADLTKHRLENTDPLMQFIQINVQKAYQDKVAMSNLKDKISFLESKISYLEQAVNECNRIRKEQEISTNREINEPKTFFKIEAKGLLFVILISIIISLLVVWIVFKKSLC